MNDDKYCFDCCYFRLKKYEAPCQTCKWISNNNYLDNFKSKQDAIIETVLKNRKNNK